MNEEDKILLVEDEYDTRFIFERLLTKNDYNVKAVENGEEALSALQEFKPKVIIADWTMPVMDGLQLCNAVKSNDEYKTIYFILLTARSSLKDRVTGLDVGADDFLVKPVENQELLARIRSGIRIHNLQNELKKIEHSKAIVELATTIGHKINNPLSSLVVTLQDLKTELAENGKKFDEDFFIIEESIKRIQKFVDALKNLQSPEMKDYALGNKMLNID